MFGADGRVAVLLDWELASIGPVGIDLGWWLAFDEFTTRAHGVDPVRGYPDRAATIERYERLTGRAVEHVRWFEVHCAWVLTVTVIRMADIAVAAGRLPRGQPDGPRRSDRADARPLARPPGAGTRSRLRRTGAAYV